jgi:hypothetical protein
MVNLVLTFDLQEIMSPPHISASSSKLPPQSALHDEQGDDAVPTSHQQFNDALLINV